MLLSLLPLVGLAFACADDDHGHVHSRREYPKFPLTRPHRPLVWGDFNVLHTTDTHGWLLGHQKSDWPEPNYRQATFFRVTSDACLMLTANALHSGDLGDFASFVTHMKRTAVEKDVDLLLVDSGDLHDGTGLSDGFPPGGVDAHESNKFLERLPYDLMTIGKQVQRSSYAPGGCLLANSHELYVYANTYDMYTNFVPRLNGRYLSSNVNITVLNSDGKAVSVPVGDRYAKFTTRKCAGRRVTSLGVLYNFKSNSVNTTVQFVADMVKEQWFVEAIAEEPDVFLLVGHMPVSYDNCPNLIDFGPMVNGRSIPGPVVFNAIRAVHPYTPIMIFGGHSHIRDCQQYDGRTMALESGRYMETIGWMSADLDRAAGNKNNITFTRRYLDQNRVTYEYHTTRSNSTFDTAHGRSITYGLQQLAVDFDLSYVYGTAPRTYTMNQNPYPSNGSVLTLFIAEAAPVALAINNTRAGIPSIIIANSGELRYNIFAGPFTKNDQLTATPFTDSFFYIPNVTLSVANQVLPALNAAGDVSKRSEVVKDELWARGPVEGRYREWLRSMSDARQTRRATDTTNLTPGYVTTDGCPGAGDDTLHVPLPYYAVPDYIASHPPAQTRTDTPIDLVFVDFIEQDVLAILNAVQNATHYSSADVSPYTSTLADAVVGVYAQAMWN